MALADPDIELMKTLQAGGGAAGQFTGLNTALDLRQSFIDAQRQFQMMSQLKQQETQGTVLGHAYTMAGMTGVPLDTDTVKNILQATSPGGSQKILQGLNSPAGNIASGNIPPSSIGQQSTIPSTSSSTTGTTSTTAQSSQQPFSKDKTVWDLLNDSMTQRTANLPPDKLAMLNNLPGNMKNDVQSLGEFRTLPNDLKAGRNAIYAQRVIGLTPQIYTDWSSTQAKERQNLVNQFFNPNTNNGIALMGIRQVGYHLSDLTNNIQELQRTGSPALNHGINWWQSNAESDPNLKAGVENITAVKEELTKAWAGNNNGERRVEEWGKALSLADSPQAWNAVFSKSATLLSDAVESRNDEYRSVMGADAPILSSKEKQILDNLKSMYTSGQVNTPGSQGGQNNQLTQTAAMQILQRAGGDKDKARQMAKQMGYSF